MVDDLLTIKVTKEDLAVLIISVNYFKTMIMKDDVAHLSALMQRLRAYKEYYEAKEKESQ